VSVRFGIFLELKLQTKEKENNDLILQYKKENNDLILQHNKENNDLILQHKKEINIASISIKTKLKE
jgi:hypothetical protein